MGKSSSKINYDVVFIDYTAHKPYNDRSLELDSLGGTESSTIRLAEGLAKYGYKTAIILLKYEFTPYQSDMGVYYLPGVYIDGVKAKNVIHIRTNALFNKFKKSKQFIWLHDLSCPQYDVANLQDSMVKYNVTGIGVSDWYVNDLRKAAPKATFERIYCPVDELCYSHRRPDRDKNQLVWMSSPHKGLNKALILFQELWKENNDLKLVVFNPGYWYTENQNYKNVVYLPECRKDRMRSVIAHSLCLFYPTDYKETFGLVAAEANALGVPVACYNVAALAESCGNTKAKDVDDLKRLISEWQKRRPIIYGQDQFRIENVVREWAKLLC